MTLHITPEILVPLSGQDADQTLIEQALQVGAAVNGHVAAVFAQSDPADVMIWTADGVFSSMPSTLIEAAWDGANEAWANVEACVQGFGRSGKGLQVERLVGPVEQSLARRAALADIVMFSCEVARGKGLLTGAFEAMVMDARAPVFIPRRPAQSLSAELKGPALIAWNGSLEGGRAVKAAMPFLAAASRVLIASCGLEEKSVEAELCDPTLLQARLARSGIQSEVLKLPGHDAARTILQAAHEHEVGLFIAGAYGHSRAREFIFGGATRTFLHTPTSPSLLLSH
jgi:hypothetical protein